MTLTTTAAETATDSVRPEVDAVRAEVRARDGLSHVLLTADDEAALSVRIEAGLYAAHLLASGASCAGATVEELDWLVADGEAARRQFIESNLRLVLSTARRFRGRGFTEDDVIQDGYHGLVKAVQRFDYAKGFKFSTYAVWWIRESILSGIRVAGFVKRPEGLHNQIMKVRAVKMRLFEETGRAPSVAEIADEAGLEEREVLRCFREDRPVSSLETPICEELTLGDLLADPAACDALISIEDTLDRGHLADALNARIGCLPPQDEAIVRARFGLDGNKPRPINVVAHELGLNRQTVRLRERRALAMLRDPAFSGGLESFIRPER